MTATETLGDVVALSGHPIQRCGARAVAELAGRDLPEQVSAEDLERVADLISDDAARAGTAAKDTAAYDWWKVLFALYPNAKPTQHTRSGDRVMLRAQVAEMLGADPGSGISWPCTFCGRTTRVAWGKSMLPMFDTVNMINTLPPGVTGWPACRGCRVAMWAVPYGAWVMAGSATVLTCANDAVERLFARRNVARAGRIRQLGLSGLPMTASAEMTTLEALRVHATDERVTATLWMFKNDNQDPWVRVAGTRGGVVKFLRRMHADPDCLDGWNALRSALTRRDKEGRVMVNGAAEAARTLFSPVDRPGQPPADRLPEALLRQAFEPDKVSARRLAAWRTLFCLYMEVMHQMDVSQVKPARELIVDWITQEKNPRGRFNEYVRAATSPFKLQKLLMQASARLLLDGRQPQDITAVAPALLAAGPAAQDGWRLRGLLFFDVIAELAGRGTPVGRQAGTKDGAEDEDDAVDVIGASEDEAEEWA